MNIAERERETSAALDQVDQALDVGDRRAIYEAARAAWRAWRARELAELVLRAASFGQAPRPTAPLARWKEGWLAQARLAEPFEQLALLEALAPIAKRALLVSCLDELVGLTDDPTVARAALRLLTRNQTAPNELLSLGSQWDSSVSSRLVKLVVEARDPGLIPELTAFAEQVGSSYPLERSLRARLRRAIDALAVIADPPLSTALIVRAETLAQRFTQPMTLGREAPRPASDAAGLRAAVLAHADDNTLRAIWADALQLQNDPLGTLIALQLAGPSDARAHSAAAKLVDNHWRTWLGPLAGAVVASSVVFDRGLFDACALKPLRKTNSTILSNPGWASVRSITFDGHGALTRVMTRLEEAYNLTSDGLSELRSFVFPRLRVLEVLPATWPIESVAQTRGLPALRSLMFSARALDRVLVEAATRGVDQAMLDQLLREQPTALASEWLLEAHFTENLEHLTMMGDWITEEGGWGLEALPGFLSALRARAPRLRTFEVEAARLWARPIAVRFDLERGVTDVIEREPTPRGVDAGTLARGEALARATNALWRPRA